MRPPGIRKRTLTLVINVTNKPLCATCGLIMDPIEPGQIRHPCC